MVLKVAGVGLYSRWQVLGCIEGGRCWVVFKVAGVGLYSRWQVLGGIQGGRCGLLVMLMGMTMTSIIMALAHGDDYFR